MTTIIKRRDAANVDVDLSSDIHPILQKIYATRGIHSSQGLERGLQHLLPFTGLFGIDKAVKILSQALSQQQRLLVIGDFDADGATSSALAVKALQAFGAKHIDFLVPNRFEYGYGLTAEIVAVAAQQKPDIIITVDNGISSLEGVTAAKKLGMKVVVTDHHLPGAELPNADAIVNPNQAQDNFVSKNLAGVGVIFYVMLALRSHLREVAWFERQGLAEPNMAQFLDLVALGTVADVVPLDKNNRILVYQGLQRIRAGQCGEGIQALIEIARRDRNRLVASDLGFAVGPRLNAAGRLDDMSLGIACLLSNERQQAREMASELDSLNQERRHIEQDMKTEAMQALQTIHFSNAESIPYGICLFNEGWHQGVIGILAARIKDHWHRPVIAFAQADEQYIKGSARSIKGLHIRDLLDSIATQHPNLIVKFGGHAMAAGLTIKRENFDQFSQVFTNQVKQKVSKDLLQGVLFSDGELTADDLSLDFAEILRESGPWGQAFPEPLFDGNFDILEQRLIKEKHLKLRLAVPDSGQVIDGISFNIDLEQWPNYEATQVNIAYRLDVNEYKGSRNIQLMIEKIDLVE